MGGLAFGAWDDMSVRWYGREGAWEVTDLLVKVQVSLVSKPGMTDFGLPMRFMLTPRYLTRCCSFFVSHSVSVEGLICVTGGQLTSFTRRSSWAADRKSPESMAGMIASVVVGE